MKSEQLIIINLAALVSLLFRLFQAQASAKQGAREGGRGDTTLRGTISQLSEKWNEKPPSTSPTGGEGREAIVRTKHLKHPYQWRSLVGGKGARRELRNHLPRLPPECLQNFYSKEKDLIV